MDVSIKLDIKGGEKCPQGKREKERK